MFQFSIAVFVASMIILYTGDQGGHTGNSNREKKNVSAFEQVTGQVTSGDITVGVF